MEQLTEATHALISGLTNHTHLLDHANDATTELLDIIEATAAATSAIQSSFLDRDALQNWWPYLVCPTMSLVMGSYGLPPSIFRNIGLIALGEFVGHTIFTYRLILTRAATTFFGMPQMISSNMTGPSV